MPVKTQEARPQIGEARLSRPAAAALRTAITLAGGNEVCFAAVLEDDVIARVRPVSRGDIRSVLALAGCAEAGEMLLHNHPSGLLEPSDADLDVAARFHLEGVGFGIIDNEATRVYVVTEVPRREELQGLAVDTVDADLQPGGPVAQTMVAMAGVRSYEDRPSQRAMARAVAQTFNSGGVALLEAGTGVGKSLGYLVPALRWAALNNERTIVSTNTITLQEQLVGKDLPFLQRALSDQPVRFALLKGWRNYVCLYRLDQAKSAGAQLFEDNLTSEVQAITAWAAQTKDGSLADLPVAPRSEVWDEVSAEPDLCARLKCSFYDKCFLFKARREAANADVIVVNHHLLLSDIAVRRQTQNWGEAAVLPAYKRLIVDEGHHLEDAAATHLGESITRRALTRLFNRLERRGRGLLPALAVRLVMKKDLISTASLDLVQEGLTRNVAVARSNATSLFNALQFVLETGGIPVLRLGERVTSDPALEREIDESLTDLLKELSLLRNGLRIVRERLETDDRAAEAIAPLLNEVQGVTRRLHSAADALQQTLRPSGRGPEVVRWMEVTGKPGPERNVALHCVPLDLAPVLRDDLFSRVETAVVTSATLATERGFAFLERRLGLADSELSRTTAILPSPFDYATQAMLVVPTDLPAPNEDAAAHMNAVHIQVRDLIESSAGGIFVLFTSHRDVRDMAARLRNDGVEGRWPLLVHGEEPRDVLLQRFRELGNAVLLGTATFWEGVDVPGDALRGLLIAKLPFRVPTEPMVAAQCEAIELRGGNAFRDFMLPHAALRLKQGFGRLIRSSADRGVVVLSDPRVLSKAYGRDLLRTLPPARQLSGPWPMVREEVARFYRSMHLDF